MSELIIKVKCQKNNELPDGLYLNETISFPDSQWQHIIPKVNKLIAEVLEIKKRRR